jgi:zinc transport system permease protein
VTRVIFMLLLASVIAIAMKIVGVLLITALLIIPAATARRLSATPEQMAVASAIVGALAVTGGLFGSLRFDTPSGPSIVVAALGLFLVSVALPVQLWRGRREAQ